MQWSQATIASSPESTRTWNSALVDPADGPGVRLDHPVREPHAIEDADVRLAHLLVARQRPLFGRVERVRVLHDELAGAQQAAAGARFVSELGLYLVERLREVAPAPELAPGDVGDDLFVGGAEVVVGAFAVAETKEDVAVKVPAAGLFEVVGRQERRHEDLERARAVHLGADDPLDLAKNAEAERQKIVRSGADATDVAGAREEHVARVRGVGGGLFHRRDEGAREEHGPGACSIGGRGSRGPAAPTTGGGPSGSAAAGLAQVRWKS